MMNRRDALQSLSLAGGASLIGSKEALAEALTPAPHPGYAQAVAGTAPVKIRNITTILTAPNRIRLVVVKVETSEPGLVGWGCATFTQRALVVKTALDQYLKPFLIGRNVDEIETSSPALDLSPGKQYTHVHRTFHLVGPEADLDRIARATLKVGLADIANAFRPAPAR